jgi:peptide/nickel transport system ATP-binding protein
VSDPGELLLDIQDLKTHFATDDGMVHAVDGVDLTIHRGETVGVVGESGCGKTVTAMTILKLIAMPPGRIVGGRILWLGRDLVPLGPEEMRAIRSKEIGIVFQEPMTSLNPVYTIGDQIAEVLRLHEGLGRRAALERTVEMLRLVRIPTPERRVRDYPHQFSGGMRQRVMIAMALALDPDVLIADEPTTALDVTVQAQIMRLLQEMQRERDMGLILITHDMGVVADVADEICVMYAGRIVEKADVMSIYEDPAHPYTKALLESIPRVDMKGTQLAAIEGLPPNLTQLPPGCSFHPRCGFRKDNCSVDVPPLYDVAPRRQSACHYYEEVLDS